MKFDIYFIEKMILDILEKKKWKENDYDYWLRRAYWNIEKKMRFDVYFIEKMILDILEKKKWKENDYDYWLRKESIKK